MKYFKLEEFIKTNTGLPNTPNEEQKKNIEALVEKVLDPVREKLGLPIIITSGFRSASVNKKVGGASTSQHLKGQAADIKCSDMKRLWEILKSFTTDQLINEFDYSWVHVSFRADGKNRKQILSAKKVNGKTIYTKIV